MVHWCTCSGVQHFTAGAHRLVSCTCTFMDANKILFHTIAQWLADWLFGWLAAHHHAVLLNSMRMCACEFRFWNESRAQFYFILFYKILVLLFVCSIFYRNFIAFLIVVFVIVVVIVLIEYVFYAPFKTTTKIAIEYVQPQIKYFQIQFNICTQFRLIDACVFTILNLIELNWIGLMCNQNHVYSILIWPGRSTNANFISSTFCSVWSLVVFFLVPGRNILLFFIFFHEYGVWSSTNCKTKLTDFPFRN